MWPPAIVRPAIGHGHRFSSLSIYPAPRVVDDLDQSPRGAGSAIASGPLAPNASSRIDAAVRIFGRLGVTCGSPVECRYRDIRALRIYEGASEVQKLVIAAQYLRDPS
jgi:alkylation response protein AidB-like acyl-CoA dehydrogenase